MSLSKNQVDRLGDKLRKQVSPIPDADLRLLDEYRRSFGEPYESMISRIRALQIEVTGRPSKTVPSIREKLLREKIRLSQMQDIAGCRIVVNDIAEQENTLAVLQSEFPGGNVVDRRLRPSHGYRAVHIVVHVPGKAMEIQLRTRLQHMWAELSEKWSDSDPPLKYGGGNPSLQGILKNVRRLVEIIEGLEKEPRVKKEVANKAREMITDALAIALKNLMRITNGLSN